MICVFSLPKLWMSFYEVFYSNFLLLFLKNYFFFKIPIRIKYCNLLIKRGERRALETLPPFFFEPIYNYSKSCIFIVLCYIVDSFIVDSPAISFFAFIFRITLKSYIHRISLNQKHNKLKFELTHFFIESELKV